MAVQIKICGLSTPETVDAALAAGATHIGLVHFEKSPRHVTLEQASKLRRRVPESVKLVLVTVAMQPEPLARAYEAIRPDVIQFHGSETGHGPVESFGLGRARDYKNLARRSAALPLVRGRHAGCYSP